MVLRPDRLHLLTVMIRSPHVYLRLLLSALLALLPLRSAAQQMSAETGTQLTVYLATYGQGDEVWEKFGHNAIWIHDASTGTTASYNYGMFDFSQAGFIPRLMRGDMLYSMGVRDADEEIAIYSYYDRDILLQRLNLLPLQRHLLREYLEWNWQPENREYRYDYFRDNCSTRLRDALDRALGGAISAELRGRPTGHTYRSHSLRLTGASVPTYAGLMLGLGSPTDRPIDAWDEGFIPMELARHLRSVQVAGPAGEQLPLVAEERVLHQSQRAAPAVAAPNRVPGFLGVGLLLGAGFALLGWAARRSRRGALALALALTVWGVTAGLFGLILTLLWVATNHVDSYANLNLLHVNPIAFILAVAGPLAVLRRTTGWNRRVMRLAWPAAVTLLTLSLAGVLLELMPGVRQMNGPLVALLLPVHAGAVLALWQAIPRTSSTPEDSEYGLRLSQAA
jgi:hypothetical protein